MAKSNAIINHVFTTREKVLMLILAVLCLGAFYNFMVVQGVNQTIDSNSIKTQELQSEIEIQQAIATNRENMEAVLESMGGAENLPVVETYDNFNAEFDELEGLLDRKSQSYTLTFGSPTVVGSSSLVRREATVTYVTSTYGKALNIARKIVNGSYRCLVTDLAFSQNTSRDSSDTVTSTLEVTYFETTEGAADTSGIEYVDEQ